MPSPEQLKAADVYSKTGICECGNVLTAHARSHEEMYISAGANQNKTKCVLTQAEVPLWNTIRPPAQPARQ